MRGGDTTLSKCTKCQKSQPFDVTEGLLVAQAHHAYDIINPYFTNKNLVQFEGLLDSITQGTKSHSMLTTYTKESTQRMRQERTR